ncbi:radical SAM domain protein [Dissulfuribacter thermophilus]|uniref:Radical SAM domain protein n=1 Tax=Dissulfuribacter thermophilus TaxID=1156395 RepID=A0A1B9F668_9BACT|nr:thio(seleno)oxazole modification radical SAM maturase SbtM [Dissulfuribacter thermophilus]OCC15437.1 radical SAM domain protein [Dissulfuribacter thermophilus]
MVYDFLQEITTSHYLSPEIRASLENALSYVKGIELDLEEIDGIEINPSIELIEDEGQRFFLVYKHPLDGELRLRPATSQDLLALKIVAEHLDLKAVSSDFNVSIGDIESTIWDAIDEGLLVIPHPKIKRDKSSFPENAFTEGLISPRVFSLQWHITQRCDLHCKHCYDRSERAPLSLEKAFEVLEELREFCWGHFVRGHVCFSGGNPFLYPHFKEIYEGAIKMGFMVSILGNPVPREWLEAMLKIGMPNYYQVSLEGLEETNDAIRGTGHFKRTLDFLTLLRELGVDSSVMLTLTNKNIDEVIPLSKILDQYTDSFTFNRLSVVGEGARLSLPKREKFWSFLEEFMTSSEEIECIYFKDNLINVLLDREGKEPFDGCTGFGCGAAFNFVALLSDGEVHACRKFPSFLGNIFEQGLETIYYSDRAQKYRNRPAECRTCRLSPACGGCFASANSFGLDIFSEKDPFCPIGDKK